MEVEVKSLKSVNPGQWLENKLGSEKELWPSSTPLTREMLLSAVDDGCYHDLPTHVKLKLLCGLLHIGSKNLENWRLEIDNLVSLSLQDPDEWVQTTGEMMRNYSIEGRINLRPDDDTSQFNRTLAELNKLGRQHFGSTADSSSTPVILPPTAAYLTTRAICADRKPPIALASATPRHFELKRRPKSAAVKAELLQKAEDVANQPNKKPMPLSNLIPVRQRSGVRPDLDNSPLRGIPTVPASKSSGGFTYERKQTPRRSQLKREGGAKLIDLEQTPQAMRLKQKECDEENKRKQRLEREQERLRLREEKERLRHEQAAERQATIDAKKQQAEQRAKEKQEAVDSAKRQRLDAGGDAAETGLSAIENPPSTAIRQPDEQPLLGDNETPDYVAKIVPRPLIQPPPMQHRFDGDGRGGARLLPPVSAQPSLTPNAPYAPQQASVLRGGSAFPQLQQQSATLNGDFRNPIQYAPAGGSLTRAPSIVGGVQPSLLVSPQINNNNLGAQQQAMMQAQLMAARLAAQQQQAMQPRATQPQQATTSAVGPTPAQYHIQESTMYQARELFSTANKLSRPEKALILGFMAGNRDNPCPQMGDILTVRLSETREYQQPTDSTGAPLPNVTSAVAVSVETFFQMNYQTGEWKKLKKVRQLRSEELA